MTLSFLTALISLSEEEERKARELEELWNRKLKEWEYCAGPPPPTHTTLPSTPSPSPHFPLSPSPIPERKCDGKVEGVEGMRERGMGEEVSERESGEMGVREGGGEEREGEGGGVREQCVSE